MDYRQFYLDFKRERVEIKLESGKEVNGYKIVGLIYADRDNYSRDKGGVKRATLEEFIQSCKHIQQGMVEMSA